MSDEQVSLDNPTTFEKALAWFKTPGKLKLVLVLAAIGGLVALVLFTVDYCGSWSTNRENEKRKANINAGMANIANKQSTIANLETEVAIEKERVRQETETHLTTVNATEQVKAETNAALSNLAAAKNANTTNSSVRQLEDVLRRLEP